MRGGSSGTSSNLVRFFDLTIGDVQLRIDRFWNRCNRSLEFAFDTTQRITIVVRNEIDRDTEMTETTRSEKKKIMRIMISCNKNIPSYTMQIRFRVAWKVKVDDDVDGLNVDTTSQQI